MEPPCSFEDAVERLVRQYPRWKADGYYFLRTAMDAASERFAAHRAEKHLSAEELYMGWCACALDEYGPLARIVLESWGISTCSDVGALVYNLIDAGIFSAQPGDTREQFDALPQMADLLDSPYLPKPSTPTDDDAR